MSAFMCSDLHLSVLAIYAVRHALYRSTDPRLEHDPLGRETAAFRMLKRENVASLDARYPGDTGTDDAESGSIVEKARTVLRTIDPIALVKQCDCYAYQACEHSGWQLSRAKSLVDAIKHHAVYSMPAYQAAPWGLE